MRILVGKCFGIGNAVLSIPMIKALTQLGHVDVLVGSGPDDFGAATVFLEFQRTFPGLIKVLIDHAMGEPVYDIAIMAIPSDGRWQNGIHFKAKTVLDGRKRPDNVERLGFDMWKKHEAEYQFENAVLLGFRGPMPSSSFLPEPIPERVGSVYLGVGYKRDAGGFGLSKHWGVERLMSFMYQCRANIQFISFCSTGAIADLIQTGAPLMCRVPSFYHFHQEDLSSSFRRLSRCQAYFGNDTGMMHVAASLGLPTYGMTPYPDLLVKNPPLCDRGVMRLFDGDTPDPTEVAHDFVDFVWGIST